MSGAVLNSRFVMRLLISDEEDIERVSVLKGDTLSAACELTVLILSITVTFSVTCLTVASTTATIANTFILQGSALTDFRVYLVAVNFCLQQ